MRPARARRRAPCWARVGVRVRVRVRVRVGFRIRARVRVRVKPCVWLGDGTRSECVRTTIYMKPCHI